MAHRCLLLGAVIIFLITLVGCGGGFNADNENAAIFEKAIFGPDTIPE